MIARDGMCAISNRRPVVRFAEPHRGLYAAHVFPVSQTSDWYRYYKRFIDDNRPAKEIGQSGLYSSQNGLLLTNEIHEAFDDFAIGVDPDVRNPTFPIFYLDL